MNFSEIQQLHSTNLKKIAEKHDFKAEKKTHLNRNASHSLLKIVYFLSIFIK